MHVSDIEYLTKQMTSFYKDFLPIDSSYELLLETYIRSFLNFWQEANYLQQHVALETSPTLHTIPYAKLEISEALYSKTEALIINKLQTLEEKVKRLNELRSYTTLTFTNPLDLDGVVCDAVLRTEFQGVPDMELYKDYFIRNNRLYLLPKFIIDNEQRLKELHAFSIKVDNRMIEKKWGAVFDIETGPLLPRGEFRNVVSAFRRLLSSDLTIRDMKSAVRLATDWETFNVRDRLTPDLPAHLKRLYDEWYISPAKFVVSLPEELIADKMRLNVLLALLDEAKEEQVSYLVLFEVFRKDYFDKHDDAYKVKVQVGHKDIVEQGDVEKYGITYKAKDTLFPQNRYDVGRHYDFKLKYDTKDTKHLEALMDAGEYVMFDDPELMMDTPWAYQIEYYDIRHIEFPEIPRAFSALRVDGDNVKFTFTTNMDGTLDYELLGSKEANGHYTVITKIQNDETLPENSIIHNASTSGMRYYKVRAIAGRDVSLMTLPVDISAL